jgi:hypothetical protein
VRARAGGSHAGERLKAQAAIPGTSTVPGGGDESPAVALPGALACASGAHSDEKLASGDAVAPWIERARGRDPDLWVIELDIPQAGQFVAEMLDGG